MRLTVVSFIAALSAACGARQPSGPQILHDPCQPIAVISPGASADRTQAISDAAQSWNVLGLTRLGPDDAASSDRVELSFKKAAGAFHGLYDPSTGTVVINDDLADPKVLAIVIAHELGHAMGLVHISPDVRLSVMNPGNTTVEPTAADSQAISTAWDACR